MGGVRSSIVGQNGQQIGIERDESFSPKQKKRDVVTNRLLYYSFGVPTDISCLNYIRVKLSGWWIFSILRIKHGFLLEGKGANHPDRIAYVSISNFWPSLFLMKKFVATCAVVLGLRPINLGCAGTTWIYFRLIVQKFRFSSNEIK